MLTDIEMTTTSSLDFLHYMTAVSHEMSDEPLFFRYLSSLGKPTDNGLVTERIQYTMPDCFSATLAKYRKSTNSQPVTSHSLCSSNSSNG